MTLIIKQFRISQNPKVTKLIGAIVAAIPEGDVAILSC